MTVPVTIGGAGPYDFLVDTGSERTVISSELARTLQLGRGPSARMQSLTGRSEVSTVIIPRLELSSRTVRSIAAPTVAHGNMGASGILGIDTLKAQHIVFDFAGRRMAIAPGRITERVSSDEIVVTARTRLGRLALSDARAQGSRIIVVLDTGAEVSMGNAALRAMLARKGRLGEARPVELIGVTGNAIPADYVPIGRVTIGGVRLSGMSVAFGEFGFFDLLDLSDRPAILLGMDVLSQFERVSVDFARREVRFLLGAAGGPALQ